MYELIIFEMFNTLEDLFDFFGYELNNIKYYAMHQDKILDIYNNGNIEQYQNNEKLFLWIGNYFNDIKHDYVKMKEYYLMAIDKECVVAMYNLAVYYEFTEQDYDKMKKYYLMAIKYGSSDSMFALGYYYFEKKDYDKMKEYLLMAIKWGNSNAMYCLGEYYQYTEINYEKMKEYYLMAIEFGNLNTVSNLCDYYKYIKDYNNAKKYYLMAIEQGNLYVTTLLHEITTPLERFMLCNRHFTHFVD